MKVAIIANPYSGRKKALSDLKIIEKKLKESGVESVIFWTEYSDHCKEIVAERDFREYDGIAIYGGDGTNYNVVNGLLAHYGEEEFPPLAILPGGSGNSFARDLNIFSLEDGVEAILRGAVKEVDVCRFTQNGKEHYFVNLLGFGFVTDVAVTAAKFKFLGDFSYVIGIFHRVLKMSFHKLRLQLDNELIEEENCFVEVCNSRYTGGGMLMAPDARIDDGKLDVVIVRPLSRLSLLRTLPKIFAGTHGENPAVSFHRAENVKIETVPSKTLLPDGEIFGKTPVEISVMPGRIGYFS